MKAAQITAYGPAENIKVVDVEKPSVSDGKVLVKVHAASLNPFDISIREGYVAKNPQLEKPLTLGGDFAGEIESVGSGVIDYKTGDQVYGSALTFAGGTGALAEYTAVPTKNLAIMPETLDFARAAALPLVGSSAVQALYDHMNLQSGQKLLIIGANGGIGTVAIQIAKHLGANVIAGVHGAADDDLKSLGADEIVDTDSQAYADLKDIDAILNLVRGTDFEKL
ncbi:MAG TPA: NADP-dependent oxidoreductase, partial [Candidatus Saccharimonadales bacterium]|nr:NADP-dependent oxidoreductase [Candidatus Saccharimonadales bacterium]